ncbi:hypothetical protein GWA01_11630 [Gluconobacter wancherniae NBRC 103581]|uniref:Uncharacterized protein n=1 Tax=Gluconobacter wancherniae NBRC 103581 TaxID=656744 RepID=A0A511B1B0_9PROT|nr:hypothetical protein AA103581_2277 [Gluconobacter wancherniae NBRC 103581]GEK93393.1 hypothetical protein GWA01_11630 [Gluconobacter wancherniae NBRC 103581]
MDEKCLATFNAHQNVFGAPAERQDFPPFKALRQIGWKWPSEVRSADNDVAQALALKGRLQATHNGFDFW